MSMSPIEPPSHERTGDDVVEFLAGLVAEGVDVDGQALPVAPDLWAVHGALVYGGDSLLAEFGTIEDARSALERIADPERRKEAR
jgi:hypothetical protein